MGIDLMLIIKHDAFYFNIQEIKYIYFLKVLLTKRFWDIYIFYNYWIINKKESCVEVLVFISETVAKRFITINFR